MRYLQAVGGPRDGDRIPDAGPIFRIPLARLMPMTAGQEILEDPPMRVGLYVYGRMRLRATVPGFCDSCQCFHTAHAKCPSGRIVDVYRWMGEE